MEKEMKEKRKNIMECQICYESFDMTLSLQQRTVGRSDNNEKNGDGTDVDEDDSRVGNAVCVEASTDDSRLFCREQIVEKESCDHHVCDDCLTRHILLQIEEQRLPIRCPGSCNSSPAAANTAVPSSYRKRSSQFLNRTVPCPARLQLQVIKRLLKSYDDDDDDDRHRSQQGIEEQRNPHLRSDDVDQEKHQTLPFNDERRSSLQLHLHEYDSTNQKMEDGSSSLAESNNANNTGSEMAKIEDDDGKFLHNRLSADGMTHDDAVLSEQSQWMKFKRLHVLSTNIHSVVPCTRCPALVLTRHDTSRNRRTNHDDDDDMNMMICADCGHSFCSVHGDRHSGTRCQDFSHTFGSSNDTMNNSGTLNGVDNSPEEIATRQYIQSSLKDESIKPCSRCFAHIYKDGGCDHIICPNCHDEFCFKCGTHVHLDGSGMIRSCRRCNGAYIDHRYIGRFRCYLCLLLPFLLPVYGIYCGAMVVTVILTFGCFFCLCCGIRRETGDANNEGPRNCNQTRLSFHPVSTMETVMFVVLLPFVHLFDAFGVHCRTGPPQRQGQQQSQYEDRSADRRRSQRERMKPRTLEIASTMETEQDE